MFPARSNPFATGATNNPFGSPTKPAATNPFAATAFGKPAATTSPFQNKGIFTSGAGAATQSATQVAQQPPIPQDPQQQVFVAADNVISHYVNVAHGDGSLRRLRDVLKPYSKAVIPEYAFRKIVYNVKDPSALKPALITTEEWERDTSASKFDEECIPRVEIMPVPIDGPVGLAARRKKQEDTIQLLSQTLQDVLHECAKVHTSKKSVLDKIETIRLRQQQFQLRLLELAKKVDEVVLRGKDMSIKEEALASIMFHLQRYLKEDAKARERAQQVMLVERMKADAAKAGLTAGKVELRADDVQQIVRHLVCNHRNLIKLGNNLTENIRVLLIAEEQLSRLASRGSDTRMMEDLS